MPRFSSVLLDLGGVVFVGDDAIPGAIESVDRLKSAGLPLRFLTNTTRRPLRKLVDELRALGLSVSDGEIFTPALAAHSLIERRGLSAHLLVHPDLLDDLADVREAVGGKADAVIVGDAGDGFTYDAMNQAFRALDGGASLIALAQNRVFKDRDGRLSLDAGPFVAALEHASGKTATVLGKPSAAFFQLALASMDASPERAVMIGDDVESDVGGAIAACLAGILVRTGKYKAGDESRYDPSSTATFDDLAAAVDWILEDAATPA